MKIRSLLQGLPFVGQAEGERLTYYVFEGNGTLPCSIAKQSWRAEHERGRSRDARMDVCGIKPSREEGRYFRNTVWYWSPLWEYVYKVCPDILTARDMIRGAYNSNLCEKSHSHRQAPPCAVLLG